MKKYNEDFGSFAGPDQTRIFFQRWQAVQPRAAVVISHGVGEHGGRFRNLLDCMQDDDISFFALDHRGHGRSEGKKGHIDSFADYTGDLDVFIRMVRTETAGVPLLLLGHSMGGTIACQYVLDYPGAVDGLILSSAGFIQAVAIPGWKKAMATVLNLVRPALSMPTKLDIQALSHDPQVVYDYEHDPLVHDLVSARWFTEFSRAEAECLRRAEELTLPLLVIHGGADPIVDPRGSRIVAERASSPDKQLFIFDDLYHETMNEYSPHREQVLQTVRTWILRQADGKFMAM